MADQVFVTPFLGLPQPNEDQARAAIIPVPLEATVSYGRGAALGPAALLYASSQVELYDELLDMRPSDLGILTRARVDVSGPVESVLDRVQAAVGAELEAGRLPAVLGGEHTVTLGALRALVQRRGADFTVLTLDAHLDLRQEYQGTPYSHACVMRRALEMGLKVRHVGVRSWSAGEMSFVRDQGLKPVTARMVHTDPNWLDAALEGLTGPIYLSLDVDGLDPSIIPATGTPEPGGLWWDQASTWLMEACRRCPVLGLDVVELAPFFGQHRSDFAAARLLHRALGLALRSRE